MSNLKSVGFWVGVIVAGLVGAVAYKIVVQPFVASNATAAKYLPSI